MNNALRTDFKRKCEKHITDPQELTDLEALFEEKSEVTQIPEKQLWKALNFPLRWVQVHALYELFRRRDPWNWSEISRIFMVGHHAWPEEELAPALAKQGYSLEKPNQPIKLQNGVAILLGPSPGNWVHQIPPGTPILKEEEVAEMAIQSGEFYLLDGSRTLEQGNLRTMLFSTDRSSIELAMEIMAKGGMPIAFTTILFSIKRSRLPLPLRKEANSFLLRYTTGTFKRNLLRNYFDLLGSDKHLLKADLGEQDPDHFLDLDQFLRLNFQLTRGGQNNGENLVGYHDGLIGLDDDFTKGILECLETERRLRFPKTTRHFPSVTYDLDHLKSIEIYHANLKSLPNGISKMPSLIKIWFNCHLESLPADIGESLSIKMVNLFNCKFPAFPARLAKLVRLKIIRWENCLSNPDQPLVLPEALFELPLHTAIIIEKAVQFPKSFYQSETLKNLTISYRSSLGQLEQLGMISSLQRIRIEFDPEETTDLPRIKRMLPDWKFEDQNERNFSFVRK